MGFPNRTRTAVYGGRGGGMGWGLREDVRWTRTVVVAGVGVEVDAEGRVHCDGCAAWISLVEATAVGSGHRAVPGRSFTRAGLVRQVDADGPAAR